jgi:TldD protein
MPAGAPAALLKEVDAWVRARVSGVLHVQASLVCVHEHMMVLASDGTCAADIRPMSRLNISLVMEGGNGCRESGAAGGGGRRALAEVMSTDYWQALADKAIHQAQFRLEARPAPAGQMPVVLGNGWCGVLLHEAVGHGLEGDFNRKGSSAFSGRVGEKVASELCTIVDDATLEGRRGSLRVDDEGIPGQYTVLVERGELKGYMQDRQNAALMGVAPTGNGRRESYAHLPMPRMTNTYMLPGAHDPGEIIASLDRGLYVTELGGGQVDITSGRFVFNTSEAWWVEGGRKQYPVKGATLIGMGPDVMKKITMVGNDLALDPGIGVCGKDGQSVPVGVGQPTLRIESLTVGGQE